MSVANLLHLREPAYVLGGMVLPETPPGLEDGGVLLFTGSDFLGRYPELMRNVFQYFAVPRGAAEAAAGVSHWGAHLDHVEELVTDGPVIKLDPRRQDMIWQLSELRVWLTSPLTEPQPSEASTAYRVGPERMLLMSNEGAAVFSKPHDSESLAEGVACAARSFDLTDDHVWSRVGVDLARILKAWIGFVTHKRHRVGTGSPNRVDPQKLRPIHWQ